MVAARDVVSADVDVFAPCALGDALDAQNASTLRARIVAGAANNVFSSSDVADRLQRRGVIYAVDYIANAGGIVYDDVMRARPRTEAFDHEAALERVDAIYDRTLLTLERAAGDGVPIWRAAEELAEARLAR